MNKWVPGLILFGAGIVALCCATLFTIWNLILLPSWTDNLAGKKFERMFLRSDPGCLAWPALFGLLLGLALMGRGLFLWLRENDK